MIFMSLFIGLAVGVPIVCFNLDLKITETIGITGCCLTVVKILGDEWRARMGSRERLDATINACASINAEDMKDMTKSRVRITVRVYNPCSFDIPVKAVELRFVSENMRDLQIPLESQQTAWMFGIPPKDGISPKTSSLLLEKRHSVEFVLEEPAEFFRKHVIPSPTKTTWIAVKSHGGELARINGKKILKTISPYLN